MHISIGLFLLLLFAVPAVAQDDWSEAAREVSEGPTYEHLTPAVKQVLVRRARHIIRTPDGRYWDGWGEFDYRRVYDRAISRQPRSQRPEVKGFIESHQLGQHWRVNPSVAAEAWKIEVRYAGSATGPRWPEDLPKLWTPMTPGADDRERIVYVNENDQTEIQRDLDEHFYMIKKQLSPTRVEVERFRRHPFHFSVKYTVDVPNERVIHRDGHLTGEYILWLPRDHEWSGGPFLRSPVWRYLPRDELSVTPQELHDAIAANRAELYEWENRKGKDGVFAWVRTPVILEYR